MSAIKVSCPHCKVNLTQKDLHKLLQELEAQQLSPEEARKIIRWPNEQKPIGFKRNTRKQ